MRQGRRGSRCRLRSFQTTACGYASSPVCQRLEAGDVPGQPRWSPGTPSPVEYQREAARAGRGESGTGGDVKTCGSAPVFSNAALRKRSLRARPMPSSGKGSTMMRSGSVCSASRRTWNKLRAASPMLPSGESTQDRSGSGPVGKQKKMRANFSPGYLPDRSRGSPICKGQRGA